jgi:Rrf2 family protein
MRVWTLASRKGTTVLAISQTAGYAIQALSWLARGDSGWRLAKDIAADAEVPVPYLSKILNALVKAQLVRAKRGYRGGFVLGRPADQIRLLDVVQAVDGSAWMGRCLLGLEVCSDERACPTHEFWKVERARIAECLASLTLEDVAAFEKARERRAAARLSAPVAPGGIVRWDADKSGNDIRRPS